MVSKPNEFFPILDKYIHRLLVESTPDKPIWNIEQINAGKPPKWNYIDGCMMTALLSLFDETGDERYLNFVDTFIDYYVAEDGSILGYDPLEYNIDNINEGRVLFDLIKLADKPKYHKAIQLIYSQLKTHPRTPNNCFWHKKIYPNQVWLDGLYMAQVFYVRYETEFNNGKNYSDIINQFGNVRSNMFDQQKKLFYHGFDCTKSAFWCDSRGLSRNFWLRAMGWFMVALVDVISYLPKTACSEIAALSEIFTETIEGVLDYIDMDSRMFYQVVDKGGDKGNYLETSGSAMIAYAILKAVRIGIVTPGYVYTGRGIFNGICRRYLTEVDGKLNLGGICLVAGLGPEGNTRRDGSYDYYISEPIVQNDAKGVAPLLMAYTEMRKIKY